MILTRLFRGFSQWKSQLCGQVELNCDQSGHESRNNQLYYRDAECNDTGREVFRIAWTPLPVGIDSFEKIRSLNFYYVD